MSGLKIFQSNPSNLQPARQETLYRVLSGETVTSYYTDNTGADFTSKYADHEILLVIPGGTTDPSRPAQKIGINARQYRDIMSWYRSVGSYDGIYLATGYDSMRNRIMVQKYCTITNGAGGSEAADSWAYAVTGATHLDLSDVIRDHKRLCDTIAEPTPIKKMQVPASAKKIEEYADFDLSFLDVSIGKLKDKLGLKDEVVSREKAEPTVKPILAAYLLI